MSSSLKWDDIKRPTNNIIRRKISDKTHLPISIGKNRDGHCLLIIELEGEHALYFKKNSVTLIGIGIDLRLEAGNQNLILTLESHVNKDLFESLCLSLIKVLKEVSDPAVGMSVALEHLKRWKSFLAGRKAKSLSPEEVRGLFAELHFLRTLLKENEDNQGKVLDAWVGPEASHQDFIFPNTAIEIKALSGRERNSIKISSEDQLEGLTDMVYLKIFRLDERQGAKSALSLNQQVKYIEKNLKNSEDLGTFTDKLSAAGYLPLDVYDDPCFLVINETTYNVCEGFPRIIKSTLPEGISKVRYEISLPTIKPFICDNKIIWRN